MAFVIGLSSMALSDTKTKGHPSRKFNSEMRFVVSVRDKLGDDWRQLAATPARKPLRIPDCKMWRVEVYEKDADIEQIAEEIGRKKIPGLHINVPVSKENMNVICDIKSIESLSLTGCSGAEKAYEPIRKLKRLKELDFTNCKLISEQVMEVVSKLPELEYLALNNSLVPIGGFKLLGDNSHLKVFRMSNFKIHDLCIKFLPKHLEYLELWACGITNGSLRPLQDMHNLKGLDLAGNDGLTGYDLKTIGQLKKLEKLNIRMWGTISQEDLRSFGQSVELKELFLGGPTITDGQMKALEVFSKLRVLELNLCDITNEGLKSLGQITKLQRLSLDRCYKITGSGLDMLAKLPELRELSLYRCRKVDNTALKNISRATKLENLNLMGCTKIQSDNDKFKPLIKCKNLKYLNLRGTPCKRSEIRKLLDEHLEDCYLID